MIPTAPSVAPDAFIDRDDDAYGDAVSADESAGDATSSAPSVEASGEPNAPPDQTTDNGDANQSTDAGSIDDNRPSAADRDPTSEGRGTGEPQSSAIGDSDPLLAAESSANSDGATSWVDGLSSDAILRLYCLERDIDYKIDRCRREGKDPLDLFDPSKPDYLGTPQALAPYLGGDVWLASNTDGDPPSRGLVFSAGDASADENTGPDRPIDVAQGVTDTAISEPDAAQDARAKAAERLARSMRAGGDANTNLLPLTLLLALPFAPEMAPAILEADGAGATLSADVVGALRTVWPKIKNAVTQLPQFVRLGHNPLGFSFDDFLKEIQTHQNDPSETGDEPGPQSGHSGQPSTAQDEIQKLRHKEARDLLGLLDPDNPVLKDDDGSTGTPTDDDVDRIRNEIEKQKGKAESIIGSPIEEHHNAPREHRDRFEGAGLDIEKYKTYIKRNDHRLKPGGLHTGQNHWNQQWSDFFQQNRTANADKIHEQLLKMMKGLPRWKR